jgi:uncharacterized membrane protein (UPF0127 family)
MTNLQKLPSTQLLRSDSEQVLVPQLFVAKKFFDRAWGLLGQSSFEQNKGLWIHRCSSIHTFFMKIPIDAVFVDRQLKVVGIYENLKPFRMTTWVWKSDSVIELPSGSVQRLKIHRGEVFRVVSAVS